MSYSIIAPGVSPENFGAGTNDSFVSRLTNGLYSNFKKADEFSTMMQNQNSRLRRRPSDDSAAIAADRESSITDYNDMKEEQAKHAVNTCNYYGDNSPQCLAWKEKLDNINKAKKLAAEQKQAMLTPSVLTTPSVLSTQPAMTRAYPMSADGVSIISNWWE